MRKFFCLCITMIAMTTSSAFAAETPRMNLDEARKYMLLLINKDRAEHDLKPVALDETANIAAQVHAEEMAQNVYLSHVNLAGEKPDVRYTKAGGVDSASENTYLWWSSYSSTPPTSLPLQVPEQTFARSDIEAIEASYMNEVPPLDGHRRQILNPHHTHVGIGLGRATDGKSIALANTQEFVQRYFALDPIPQTASAGDKITISGVAPLSRPIHAIAIGVEELPAPKTREQVSALGGYRRPEPSAWLFAGRDFKVEKDGRFEKTVEIAKASGAYYFMIWLRDDLKKTGTDGLFIASCRVVLVR